MPEQLQKILNQISEWWKKFNTKQKTLLISLTSAVIIALVILAVVMTRPTYVTLINAENYKEASAIKELLDGDGTIRYKIDNTTNFQVDVRDESDANLLLGSNGYSTNGYDISNPDLESVINGGFSRTSEDTQKAYKKYLEDKFAKDLSAQSLINSATVSLDITKDDGTLVSQMQESFVTVTLDLAGPMSADQAYGIARMMATCIGNDSTEHVTIINQADSKILYSGADQNSDSMLISNQMDQEQAQAARVKEDIKDALVASGLFSNVEVGLKLDMSFNDVEEVVHTFWHNEGMDTGEIASESIYSASGTGSTGGVPGTYSNSDNTDYYIGNTDGDWAVSDEDRTYNNNEKITTTKNSTGVVNYDNCSAAVVAVRNVVYDEDVVRADGRLDNMTWEEFKAANGDNTQITADPVYVSAVSKIVGCNQTDVEFICIEKPVFVDSKSGGIGVTDILQIALAVLIFALLGYVVFRSTRKQKEEELEPELSVEALLESTSENQEELEDIGYTEKSETRLMIEKFVDEKPDAAALLLRNWLNEDWE